MITKCYVWTSSRMSFSFIAFHATRSISCSSHSLAFMILAFHVYISQYSNNRRFNNNRFSPIFTVSIHCTNIYNRNVVEPLENCVLWVNLKANATKDQILPLDSGSAIVLPFLTLWFYQIIFLSKNQYCCCCCCFFLSSAKSGKARDNHTTYNKSNETSRTSIKMHVWVIK